MNEQNEDDSRPPTRSPDPRLREFLLPKEVRRERVEGLRGAYSSALRRKTPVSPTSIKVASLTTSQEKREVSEEADGRSYSLTDMNGEYSASYDAQIEDFDEELLKKHKSELSEMNEAIIRLKKEKGGQEKEQEQEVRQSTKRPPKAAVSKDVEAPDDSEEFMKELIAFIKHQESKGYHGDARDPVPAQVEAPGQQPSSEGPG